MRNFFTRPTLPDYAPITPDMFPRTMPAAITSQSHLTSAPTKDLRAHLNNVIESSKAAVTLLDEEIAFRQGAKANHLKAIEAATAALGVITLPEPPAIDEQKLVDDMQAELDLEDFAAPRPADAAPAGLVSDLPPALAGVLA